MQKILKKSSLQTRLLTLLFLGFVVIVLASTFLVRGYLHEEYRQIFYENEQRVLSSLTEQLEGELERQEASLQALAEQLVTL
ncbi:hypothetical protein SAMN05660443_2660 [Marinospirillum celere]|uniref:Uncharacterized protein n=1 Tax=Marinospirillum celere TaxID=1122252 RepID=A0A1I1J7Q6_9GAMM|nr:hypothetical protein [Marinospirillum celere]SFC44584.1 hypothetical protein SAMN05660443_2660 [Marinospirillum celere]